MCWEIIGMVILEGWKKNRKIQNFGVLIKKKCNVITVVGKKKKKKILLCIGWRS